MTGRDGRQFDLVDPGAVVRAFQANGADLPVDFEHQADNPAAKALGPVPAAGWIKELKARPDGIWGRVEWTATAAEMIGKREYRYLSPTFNYHRDTGQIMRLSGAGLVHHPNLFLHALNRQEPAMALPPKPASTPTLATLVAALNLPPDSTPMDVLAAVRAILAAAIGADPASAPDDVGQAMAAQAPDPRKYVPVEAVAELLRDRNERGATIAKERAALKVTEALRKGFISPAMKGWATALCAADEASFDAFLSSTTPMFGHLVTPSALNRVAPGTGILGNASTEAEMVCAQLGLKPGSLRD